MFIMKVIFKSNESILDEIENKEDYKNTIIFEFYPYDSNDYKKEKSYGIMIITVKTNEQYNYGALKINNHNSKQLSIGPFKYKKDNSYMLEKIYKFLRESYEYYKKDPMDDYNFNSEVVYKYNDNEYKIALEYNNGEVDLVISNDNEVICAHKFSDYEIENLYNFFNVVLHYINHNDEKITNAAIMSDHVWSNLDIEKF